MESIADKLVRRHPHVFARAAGEAPLDTAGQVRTRWEDIKAQERAGRRDEAAPKTLLSGIAPALPALLRAYHIGVRAASVGFDWSRPADVVEKIREEVEEIREVADGTGNPGRLEEEVDAEDARRISERERCEQRGPADGHRYRAAEREPTALEDDEARVHDTSDAPMMSF